MGDRIKLEDLGCGQTEQRINIDRGDIIYFSIWALIDAQWLAWRRVCKAFVTCQDAKKIRNKTKVRFVMIACEEFPFSILTVLLFLESQLDFFYQGRVSQSLGERKGRGINGKTEYVIQGECVGVLEPVFVKGTDGSVGDLGLRPFDTSAAGVQVA